MLNINLEKKISIGQIIVAFVFILGLAIGWGSMDTKVQALEKDKENYVRKTELEPELRGIREELGTIKTIAFSYVTGRGLSTREVERIGREIYYESLKNKTILDSSSVNMYNQKNPK